MHSVKQPFCMIFAEESRFLPVGCKDFNILAWFVVFTIFSIFIHRKTALPSEIKLFWRFYMTKKKKRFLSML